MFRAGDRIGPYILISQIGRGGLGVVWLAEIRTTITTTSVAVKMPLDEDIELDTIRQEANLWVHASGHPNVLPIIEANVYDGQVVIVSEYAPDGSLDAWLRRYGGAAPSIETAAEMASGILAGLEHLHSRHIIHRDLKPQNLLIQGQTPRLADFGISRILKSTSQSGIVAGTPVYMAPEAFDGKRNEQTDIWSVGVMFYEMLAGNLPFPQTDLTSLVGAILTRNPDPLPTSVPGPLQETISRSLARDLTQRYKSATEMRAALRNAMETIRQGNYATSGQDRAPNYSPPLTRTAPRKSRVKVWASILAGILLAGVLVASRIANHWASTESASSAERSSSTEQASKAEKDGADVRRWLAMLGHFDNVPEVVRQTSAELASSPLNPLALRARSAAYYSLHDDDTGKRDAEQVEQLLTNPTSAEEYEARCYARWRLKKIDYALNDCTRAIELDPQYAWARFTRGGAYYEKNDYDRSIADYNKGLELNPGHSLAYNNLGIDRYFKREFNSAITDFNKAIEVDPRSALAYANRGMTYHAKQQYDSALADYSKAIELDPRWALAYDNRGLVHLAMRDYDGALADQSRAIELDPRSAGAYAHRASIYNAKQQYDSALADCGKAIELDPRNETAYIERGNAYYSKQDYNSALADYNKAIQLDPKNAGAYVNRGVDYYAKQEYDSALADCAKAIQLDPRNANAYLCRGNAYYSKQDYASAILDYTKAIEFNPQFAVAYGNRANAYQATGESRSAAADREKAQELKE